MCVCGEKLFVAHSLYNRTWLRSDSNFVQKTVLDGEHPWRMWGPADSSENTGVLFSELSFHYLRNSLFQCYPFFKKTYNLEIISNLQKSWKSSTKNSHIPFLCISLSLAPACYIYLYLCSHNNFLWNIWE